MQANSATTLFTNDLLDMEIISPSGASSYSWSGPGLSSADEFLSGLVNSANSGIYTASVMDANGCSGTTTINITVNAAAVLSAKALLSGPYVVNAGLMADSLRAFGMIPTTEPYGSTPYNTIFSHVNGNAGASCDPSVFLTTGNDAIVDWVFIQLRNASNSSTVVATRSALIQRDGDIVSVDGVSPVTFQGTTPGNYFVTIKHRNHLGIMTLGATNITEAGTAINFTNPTTPLFTRAAPNNNPSPLTGAARVQGGKLTMYAGNCNITTVANSRFISSNSTVTSDRTALFNYTGFTGSINGYSIFDCDMNGTARFNGLNPDRLTILLNCVNNANSTNNVIVNEQTPN